MRRSVQQVNRAARPAFPEIGASGRLGTRVETPEPGHLLLKIPAGDRHTDINYQQLEEILADFSALGRATYLNDPRGGLVALLL
jgi:hypothetical protein